ncbi:hypothetical protein BGZ47_003999, partial [Haplosporangium gracile]
MAANTTKKNEDAGSKVVGALDALTLTSGRDEGAGMDVDVDMQEETVDPDFMDAHGARGKMKEYSMQLVTLTKQKMRLSARIQELSQEEADLERPKVAELTRQIKEAKTAMNEWNVMLDDLESAERSMGRTAFSSVVTRDENEELRVKKGGKIDEIKLSNEFPRYHRLVETHLLPVLDIKIHGPLITNVREFLYEFHRIGVTKFTTVGFDERCSRLLCLANMDRKASDAMNAVLSRDPEGKWPWARCEKVFVESAMTQTERTDEVEKVIKMGLERGESYKQYYHRMKRLMDVYQVKDLPKFADLLFLLQRAVDPIVLTMILMQKRIAVLEGMMGVAPDETTFESYMESLQHMQGPADSDEWAPVISERRRLTGAADNEAARQAQSLKDRLI